MVTNGMFIDVSARNAVQFAFRKEGVILNGCLLKHQVTKSRFVDITVGFSWYIFIGFFRIKTVLRKMMINNTDYCSIRTSYPSNWG
jgi:hypothetical protein